MIGTTAQGGNGGSPSGFARSPMKKPGTAAGNSHLGGGNKDAAGHGSQERILSSPTSVSM